MKRTQVIVVEDEIIIAMDIQERLITMGYDVPVILSSGEEALDAIADIQPDLILMDIMLKGEMNGIAVASQIRTCFDIPVIYLTAYADEKTLQQAKVTEPFGYILKPFEERELQSTIEMGLYKHKMQRMLKESQQRLATTLNSLDEAIVTTDAQSRITFMNPMAELLTGWKKEKAIGEELVNVLNLVSKKDDIQSLVRKVLHEAQIEILDHHSLIAPDDTLRILDGSVVPITNGKNKTIGVVLAFRDITDRKESDIRHRMLLEASPDPVVFYDLQGRATYVNPAFTDVFGWEAAELLGEKIDFVPEKNWPETIKNIKLLTEQGWISQFETQRFTKNGDILDVDINAAQVRNDNNEPTGSVIQFRDITARKQAERAQRESKQRVNELRVAAEVSEQLSAILQLDQLLLTTVQLLQDRFDLYYVFIYLLEEDGLVRRVGSGKIEDILAEQSDSIALDDDKSLVARVAREQQALFLHDTRLFPLQPNALLPHTRSEMAVPLMTAGRLLGVLDIQDDEVKRFTQTDLDLFNLLAGHVATALENARLFEQQKQSQQALQDQRGFLRQVIDLNPQFVFAKDRKGHYTLVNQAFAEAYGSTVSELVGKHDSYFHSNREEVAHFHRYDQAVLNSGEERVIPLEKITDVRGETRWLQTIKRPIIENSQVTQILGVSTDITERIQTEEELSRLATGLRTAADLTEHLTSILDPETLLQEIVSQLQERFNLYHVQIYLLDRSLETLIMRAGSSEVGQLLHQRGHHILLQTEKSLVARAARTQQAVIVGDVQLDVDFLPNPLLPDTRSEVAIPLIQRGELIGVLDVQDDKPYRFIQSDIDTFNTLAAQITIALENAKLFEEIKQINEERLSRERRKSEIQRQHLSQLRIAADISKQLSTILDPERLLDKTVTLLQQYFDLYHVHIYLFDHTNRYLIMRAGSGKIGQQLRTQHHQIRFDIEHSLVARAARESKPIVVNDVEKATDFLPNPLLCSTRSEVAIPLIVRGQVMGVLDVQDDTPERFSQADLDSLNTLAGQIATSLSNAYFFEKVEQSLNESNLKLSLTQALANTQSEADVLNILIEQAKIIYPDVEIAILLRHNDDHQVAARSNTFPLPIGWQATTEEWPLVQDLIALQAITSVDTFLAFTEDEAENDTLLSSALLPISTAEEWIGSLLCATPVYDFFQERIVRLYQILAEQGAIALQAARLRAATEEARAEVERERALLDGILQNLPSGVMVVDQQGKLLRANQVAEELLGRVVAEPGKPSYLEQYEVIHRATGEPYTEERLPLRQALQTGQKHSASDISVRKPDGSLVHLLANSGPLYQDGTQTGGMVSFADISERVRAEEEVARFASQLRIAAELAEQISAIHELHELLKVLVSELQQKFKLYHVQVYLLDNSQLTIQSGSGAIGEQLRAQGHTIALDANSLVAQAARDRQLIVVNDVKTDPNFLANPLLPETRAEIAVPLIVGERVLGVLDLQDKTLNRFGQSEQDVFRTLSGQIATTLQNAKLFSQLEESLEEARLRVRVNQELAVTRTEEEVLQTIMALSSIYRDVQITLSLNQFHGQERQAVIYDSRALDSGILPIPRGMTLQADQMPFIEYIANHLYFVTDDLFADERVDEPIRQMARQTGGVSFLVVQLKVGQAQIGSLTVSSPKKSYFAKHKVQLFRNIAQRGAIAIREARLFEKVQNNLEQTRIRFEVSQALAAAQTEEEVLNVMIEHASFDPSIMASIAIRDEEADEMTLVVRRSNSFGHEVELLPLGTALSENNLPELEFLLKNKMRLVLNVQDEPRISDETRQRLLEMGVKSALALPMIAGNKLLGMVNILSRREGVFENPHIIALYQSFIEQSAIALHSAQLFDEKIRIAERLREVDRLKSEFLANMSHELRTPLNSIIGYSEIMLMGINGPLNDETMEDVQAIRTSGRHLLSLINDILDLAKIEAGRMVLEIEPIDMQSLLDSVRVNNLALFHQKSVEFEINVQEDIPIIEGDRVRINQILTNLVGNAIKFTDEGRVTLQATHDEDWIVLDVIDTGMGIEEEHLNTIFAQFRQVDGSSTRRAEGTGLGLAITQHLVEMHGGTISVKSQLDEGSVFTVRLPVKHFTQQQ